MYESIKIMYQMHITDTFIKKICVYKKGYFLHFKNFAMMWECDRVDLNWSTFKSETD